MIIYFYLTFKGKEEAVANNKDMRNKRSCGK